MAEYFSKTKIPGLRVKKIEVCFVDKLKKEDISTNLRKYKRHQSIMRVTISQDRSSELLRANTLDISQGGLFITTSISFEYNRNLEVQIYDVVPDSIKTTVRVVWMRPWDVPHQLPGIGVQFISFAQDADRYVLMEYLNKFQEKCNGTP